MFIPSAILNVIFYLVKNLMEIISDMQVADNLFAVFLVIIFLTEVLLRLAAAFFRF